MSPLSLDLSVYNKFKFNKPPVGVKYLYDKPDKIKKLDQKLTLCQMPQEAQDRGESFYVDAEVNSCGAALYILGGELPGIIEAGYLGAAYKVFKEPRANRRLYNVIPRLDKNIARYIVFSPLDKISFDPDLLIILTDNSGQTEVLLRASSYATGKMWSSKTTSVIACAWLFAHPYLSGELNYIDTALSYGMKRLKVYEGCRHLISIPFDLIPDITQNLKEMPWVLPGLTEKGEEFRQKVYKELNITPRAVYPGQK
jgi:uncharacterized protein (DUF169 family)